MGELGNDKNKSPCKNIENNGDIMDVDGENLIVSSPHNDDKDEKNEKMEKDKGNKDCASKKQSAASTEKKQGKNEVCYYIDLCMISNIIIASYILLVMT